MSSDTDPSITKLQAELSEWVDRELSKFQPPKVRDRKLIRDAVHGFFLLEPYEVEIIDSPIMQRLRYIHQTAFAYLVYPGMNHTRFEHSLGVAHIANQMLNALAINVGIEFTPNQRAELLKSGKKLITDGEGTALFSDA